jgi:hypothetical protein
MFSSDCEKHMCDKNIRSTKEWRNEMLHLRKTLPNYETHPEFVKTAQCKEVLCTSPSEKDEFTEEIRKLEADLKFINETLTTLNTNVFNNKELLKLHKQKLNTYNIIIKNVNADVRNAEASIKQNEKYIKHYNAELVNIQKQIHIKQQKQKEKEQPQPASTSQKAPNQKAPNQKAPNQKAPSQTSKKAPNKKASPTTKKAASPTTKKAASPTEFEYDQTKRCPNGYQRNKTTKKCQKK